MSDLKVLTAGFSFSIRKAEKENLLNGTTHLNPEILMGVGKRGSQNAMESTQRRIESEGTLNAECRILNIQSIHMYAKVILKVAKLTSEEKTKNSKLKIIF